MGKWGMAVDNLVGAEVVLANGEIVQASESTEPDLFWAIARRRRQLRRGHELHVPRISAVDASSEDRSSIRSKPHPDVVRFVREFGDTASDDVSLQVAFIHAPDGSGMKVVRHRRLSHRSRRSAGRSRPASRSASSAKPLVDIIGRIRTRRSTRRSMPSSREAHSTTGSQRSSPTSRDEAVGKMIDAFQNSPTTMCASRSRTLRRRASPGSTRQPPRSHTGSPATTSSSRRNGRTRSQTDECVAWTRNLFDALRPHMSRRRRTSTTSRRTTSTVSAAAYGPNYDRLVELKRRYDPDNLFRLNQNISPPVLSTSSRGSQVHPP